MQDMPASRHTAIAAACPPPEPAALPALPGPVRLHRRAVDGSTEACERRNGSMRKKPKQLGSATRASAGPDGGS